MQFYICCGLLLVFLICITVHILSKKYYPYRARPLLTKREYKFYMILREETSRRNLIICPKVGVKDLLEVNNKRHYMKYFRKIAQKHIDFVICDQQLHVLFAIELDDSSHDTDEARKRDIFKDRAFRAAKIPLKRIRDFDEDAVQKLFRGVY